MTDEKDQDLQAEPAQDRLPEETGDASETVKTPPAADPQSTDGTNRSEGSAGSKGSEKSEGSDVTDQTDGAPKQELPPREPAHYAFHWDYRMQGEQTRAEKKTVRVRAGLFYGLAVGAMFLVLLLLLLVVLLIGESRGTIPIGGGTLSGTTERVVYVNGDGDAEEQLAVEAAVAKMLPSSVSILVSSNTGSGVGSGIVLSEDGYIATNHHVIAGKTSVTVRLYGGARYAATVVGSDETSDLALLKIDATGLTPATFADSDELLVGQTVMAIGTPTGISYSETVTRGIVSCTGRAVKVYSSGGSLSHSLMMIQTDASVNPGNSGGPLLDRNGEVIGVIANKTVFYESGTTYYADGMGLAIPANAARQILDDLKNGREPDRSLFLIPAARLGISGQNVTEGAVYGRTGVLVTAFSSEYYDAAQKLAKNDIIVALDGYRVSQISEVQSMLEEYVPGATVLFTVFRNGSEITVEVVLGSDATAG